MKKARLFISLLILLVAANCLFAQEANNNSMTCNNKGLYFGGQLSTNGWGFDIKYIFNKSITLKSGVETLAFFHDFNFDENGIDYNASLDYTTGGVFLLADFNYTKNLYVSLGAALNLLNPKVKGHAVSDLKYGDIIIPASQVGDFVFSLTPGYKISPYAGVGLRSFLGKKERIIYYFETGFYYVGAPNIEIEATGLLSPTANPAHSQQEVFENQLSQYKFYPVIKFSLAFKLFNATNN